MPDTSSPWTIAALVVLSGLILAAWLRPPPSGATLRAIEAHFAAEGGVIFVRPRLIPLGRTAPGARQYTVRVAAASGRSQDHAVEVDGSGAVRTLL